MENETGGKGSYLKAIVLLAFIAAAVYLVRFSPVKNDFTADALDHLLQMAGFWAAPVFILVYATAVCLFIPGTLLTAIGAALFGVWQGFIYVWVAAMLGASISFVIGRTLGREFAASLVGGTLKKFDDAIERNGFETVLYLRLIYFPFSVLNFGMGLTRVSFLDYFAGTGLGIVVGTFVFTFFIGTIRDIWVSGNWNQLVSAKVFLSLGLFVFSFFIPVIIKKIRGSR